MGKFVGPAIGAWLTVVLAATPAAAVEMAAGRWAIEGKVGSKTFTLDCRFSQAGDAVSGACIDGDTHDARVKGGRSHTLTMGRLDGDKIAFTYQSSFLFSKFDAAYSGVLHGDRMTGGLSALGAKGVFTGQRLGP